MTSKRNLDPRVALRDRRGWRCRVNSKVKRRETYALIYDTIRYELSASAVSLVKRISVQIPYTHTHIHTHTHTHTTQTHIWLYIESNDARPHPHPHSHPPPYPRSYLLLPLMPFSISIPKGFRTNGSPDTTSTWSADSMITWQQMVTTGTGTGK